MAFKNVLLIDDDEEDTEIFCEAAKEALNIECMVCHDATEALEKLELGALTPDVIFLDLNMPVMTGQKFLQEIKMRSALRSIPVIIFSTSSQASTIQHAKELGAFDFITKPERFDDLINILKRFSN